MKLTKSKLKRIIKEELRTTLLETFPDTGGCGDTTCEAMNAEIAMLEDMIRELGGTVPGQDEAGMPVPLS